MDDTAPHAWLGLALSVSSYAKKSHCSTIPLYAALVALAHFSWHSSRVHGLSSREVPEHTSV